MGNYIVTTNSGTLASFIACTSLSGHDFLSFAFKKFLGRTALELLQAVAHG